jgi:hypothetical protein
VTEQPPRDGNGKFIYPVDSMERDAKACRLRSKGWTYPELAEHLGYPSSQAAREAVKRAMRHILAEPVEEMRAFELDRLDQLYRKVTGVLDADQPLVANGNVVYHDDSTLPDLPLVLKAVEQALKIQARRAALAGLDSATKTQVQGGVRYEVVGVDNDKLT